MTLSSLKEKHSKRGSYKTGFICDGYKYVGCKSGYDESLRTDHSETIYHCDKCSFDTCEKCFNSYGDTHHHGLEKITLAELIEKNSNYNNGWFCDCIHYQGCPYGGKTFDDEFAIVYHHDECMFDLCEKCSTSYKI